MQPAEWKDWLVKRVKSLLDTNNQGSRQIAKRTWAYILGHRKQSATIAAVFVLGLSSATYAYYSANTATLYHVKLNGKELGVVDNPSVVETWMDNKRKNEEEKQGAALTLSDKIVYAEEQVFNGKVDNEETLRTLDAELDLHVEAVKITVDDKVVGYAANEEEANKVLDSVKTRYSGVLPKKETKQEVKAASLPDTVVKTVEFKEEIDMEKDSILAEQIMPVEEIEQLLLKGTAQEAVHSVKQGDTISGIAKQYGITQKEILRNNPGLTETTLLQLDQKLNVTEVRPFVTVQVVENLTTEEPVYHKIETRSNPKMLKGETKVVQEGKNGQKRVQYEVVKENGQQVAKKVLSWDVLQEPVTKVVEKGTKVIADRGSGRIIWPAKGNISSGYGKRWGRLHKGLDIAGSGTIVAADNGRVVQAGWNGNYGLSVTIDHNNGMRTLYGHMRSINVKNGQVVSQGAPIGVMGSTGQSTGVHLHFEVIKNGSVINPLTMLR
ncbi:M23 family metallopeptidase [Brevibacillus daliensis]